MTDLNQAREALDFGNTRRLKMAQTKTALRRMSPDRALRQAAKIILAPNADQGAIRVHQILGAVPRLGEVGITEIVMYAGVMRPDKRLRDLTDRQRDRLAEALRFSAVMGPTYGPRALRRGEIGDRAA